MSEELEDNYVPSIPRFRVIEVDGIFFPQIEVAYNSYDLGGDTKFETFSPQGFDSSGLAISCMKFEAARYKANNLRDEDLNIITVIEP